LDLYWLCGLIVQIARAQLPVSVAWLQSPNEQDRNALLEYTRGVLYGLASTDASAQSTCRPIHTSRIRAAFCNLGTPTLYRLGLRMAHLLREVEPLFGGHWLLTPFRVIEIETHHAFIGAIPSVSGRLEDVYHEGLGRFISPLVASRFPSQSVDSWMDLSGMSISNQISGFVSAHHLHAAPTIHSDDIEFFKVITAGVQGRRFSWTREPNACLPAERIALCRQKRTGVVRYFSAELRNGRVATEANVGQPIARLMFASASRSGIPVPVKVRQQGGMTHIAVPERLPTEEYRLALLLAIDVFRQGSTTSFLVERSKAPILLKHLTSLGCSVEISA
jgi:hypothetical protein